MAVAAVAHSGLGAPELRHQGVTRRGQHLLYLDSIGFSTDLLPYSVLLFMNFGTATISHTGSTTLIDNRNSSCKNNTKTLSPILRNTVTVLSVRH